LDSRVTTLFGYELGYKNQIAFTCSQKGYDDEIIAREIAKDYGFKHHFYPMDGLEYFYEPKKMMRKIGGTCDYNDPAHVVYGVEKIWKPNFGLIHSGHLGGMILGSYISAKKEQPPTLTSSRISTDYLPIDRDWEMTQAKKYQHEGHYKISERGLNSIASGVWALEHLSYNIAPFTHADFIDFALTIPYNLIYKRKIYLAWLNRYHPEWTKYQTFDMAPEQYWFEEQPKLKIFLETQTFPLLDQFRQMDIPYFSVVEKMAKSEEVQLRVRALSFLLVMEKIMP